MVALYLAVLEAEVDLLLPQDFLGQVELAVKEMLVATEVHPTVLVVEGLGRLVFQQTVLYLLVMVAQELHG